MGCAASEPVVHQHHMVHTTHQQRQVIVHAQAPQQQTHIIQPVQTFQKVPPPQQAPPPQRAPPPVQQQAPPPVQQQAPLQAQAPPLLPVPQDDDIQPAVVEINEALVQTIVELDKEISALESCNVTKQHQLKSDQLAKLTARVQKMAHEQQALDQSTKKEYQDIINLQNMQSTRQMMTQGQFNMQMSKENEEYMQALTKQEVHKKELAETAKQLEAYKKEVEPLKMQSEHLKELYDKQDGILASVFDGKYGSEREFNLESDLDILLERKQRVGVAKYKWQNAKTLLQHAGGQLGFAIRRWGDVLQIPPQNTDIRYKFAAEARNNLVAGSQNITSASGYLNTIRFPYCTKEELQVLNMAINHVFTDLLTPERHKHAMECYVTVYKRTGALIQWCDHVINKTILKDLESATKECATKKQELKHERLKLIKEKIREKLGDEAADKIELASDVPAEVEDIDKDDAELLMLVEADAVSQAGDLATLAPEGNDGQAITPIPLTELAPTPSMDDLFGNIDQLKKQHEENVKELERQQDMAKARVDQDLQAKLAKRRSRRRRVQAQETEMQSLAEQTS